MVNKLYYRYLYYYNYYFNRRKSFCNNYKIILFSVLLFLTISDNLNKNSLASASLYHPTWQQYYPYRTWPSYNEQIQGRPPRLRVGQGRYRLMPAGAQLMCDFPDNRMLMISNIVWERADMGHGNSIDDIYRDHGIQQDYLLFSRPHGSTLHLLDVTPLDRGLYRCIASALDPKTGKTITLFQDVHFYPAF